MNSDFTSHAGNFCGALQTQVDPRTGQFMVNFPVVNSIGNHQLGPELSISLKDLDMDFRSRPPNSTIGRIHCILLAVNNTK